ncbi:MAG TPA: ABC transporter permease [Blastocatellia bacterium]
MDNLVFSNILHRRARSVTTAGGVALGVALVILAVGLVHGFLHTQGRKNASVAADILFASPAATFGFGFSSSLAATLPVDTVDQIADVPGVKTISPVYQYLDANRMVDGIDYESFNQVSASRVVEGEAPKTGYEVMVDRMAQRALKLKIGSEISLLGTPFKVTGIYAPESLYRFKIPIATMQGLTHRAGACSLIMIKVGPGFEADDVYRSLAAKFPNNKMILTRDLPDLFATPTPAMRVFLGAVVAVSVAFSAMLILLTMYSTVKERTRQIGILKALGASKPWIAVQVEKEALALSLIGTMGGFALAVTGKYIIQGIAPTIVELDARWFMYALLLGILSGAIGALYPAFRAARQDPVVALAYE